MRFAFRHFVSGCLYLLGDFVVLLCFAHLVLVFNNRANMCSRRKEEELRLKKFAVTLVFVCYLVQDFVGNICLTRSRRDSQHLRECFVRNHTKRRDHFVVPANTCLTLEFSLFLRVL